MEAILARVSAAERRRIVTGVEALVDAAHAPPEDGAHDESGRSCSRSPR